MHNYSGLKKDLLENNIKFDNYLSDLYIHDNKQNRELLRKNGYFIDNNVLCVNAHFFKSELNNSKMIEIYFMYDKESFLEKNRMIK
ncbi:MAG: hypothetical protein RBR50_00995 [Candidatus Izemoplasmatales bacterium]|nr:hypothetical protein [Candidatus Izemoplasmatales bacterium]